MFSDDARTPPDAALSQSPAYEQSRPPPRPAPAPTVASRQRRVLLAAAITAALVMTVAGVVGFVIYDRSTAIDRSSPVVSSDAFLHAALVESSVVRVGLYTCRRWAAEDAMAATLTLTDPQARTSWDTFAVVSQTEDEAVLRARIRFQYPGEVAPSGEAHWRLDLIHEDGWRVCGIAETS